jgi:5'-deoxynucleotidase YfbR-like HD superfamily hydrolase
MTADINRWHSNPDPRLRNSGDTVSAHHKRVASLCQSLAAWIGHVLTDSDLLHAALNHDAAEAVIGDMPAPAKARFPALALEYALAEKAVLAEMGLYWTLTNYEAEMLHLCDKLDAFIWARNHGVTGGKWDAAEVALWKLAHGIGPDCSEWLQFVLASGAGRGKP